MELKRIHIHIHIQIQHAFGANQTLTKATEVANLHSKAIYHVYVLLKPIRGNITRNTNQTSKHEVTPRNKITSANEITENDTHNPLFFTWGKTIRDSISVAQMANRNQMNPSNEKFTAFQSSLQLRHHSRNRHNQSKNICE